MKKNKPIISTSIWIYLIIFVIFLAFILISVFLSDCEWWKNLWLNFGYGTFASLFVSILIDIGNTYRSNKESDKKYCFVVGECINCCYALRSSVMEREQFRYDLGEPMTYKEYVEEALNPDYEPTEMDDNEYDDFLFEVIYSVDKLAEAADKLASLIPFCYDSNINERLAYSIKSLTLSCRNIRRYYDKNDYKNCVNSISRLGGKIIRVFPELKNAFTSPYTEKNNEDEE